MFVTQTKKSPKRRRYSDLDSLATSEIIRLPEKEYQKKLKIQHQLMSKQYIVKKIMEFQDEYVRNLYTNHLNQYSNIVPKEWLMEFEVIFKTIKEIH